MKPLFNFLIFILLFIIFTAKTYAVYDPLSVANNKFGIHILYPEEISEAANLVNSNGGSWGYVTIPIQASDKNIEKWQKFMDECKNHKIIPLIRIATDGDYFAEGSWAKPDKYDLVDFANFLNSLNWPTQNRYVIIYNEQNRFDEWGGEPNPAEYAQILDFAIDTFKERSDKFFIIFGGLDNASVNVYGKYINQFDYMQSVENEVNGIFAKIDGISVHSYPNPAFSSPPTYLGTNSIYSFYYVNDFIKNLTGKTLPIFITETGWSNENVSSSIQKEYYKQAFNNVWNDNSIVAITPFLLNAGGGPFKQFSFIDNGKKSDTYLGYFEFKKIKGEPILEKSNMTPANINRDLKTKNFVEMFTESIFQKINSDTKEFIKWIINY